MQKLMTLNRNGHFVSEHGDFKKMLQKGNG
jgi:hypothetical protein